MPSIASNHIIVYSIICIVIVDSTPQYAYASIVCMYVSIVDGCTKI